MSRQSRKTSKQSICDAGTEVPEAMEAMPEPVEAMTEAEVQPEDSELAMKPARKGKGKKGAASMEDADM